MKMPNKKAWDRTPSVPGPDKMQYALIHVLLTPLPQESSAKQIGNLVPLKFPVIDKRSSLLTILFIDSFSFLCHFYNLP